MQESERHGFYPWVGKMPCRRVWQLTPVFLAGESLGQRNLAGYIHRVTKSQTQQKWLGPARHTKCAVELYISNFDLIFFVTWKLCLGKETSSLSWRWTHGECSSTVVTSVEHLLYFRKLIRFYHFAHVIGMGKAWERNQALRRMWGRACVSIAV